MKSKTQSLHCGNAKHRMKPSVPCCTRTPALKFLIKPWLVIAARCWMQPSQRSHAVPRRRRQNHRQSPKGNWPGVRLSAIHGHANRASRLQKIFSAAAQVSPVAATKSDHKETRHAKKQNPLDSKSATNARSQPCNARSSRTTGRKRNRVRFGLALAASLRRTASLIPFRRPPAAFRRQCQTEADANVNCYCVSDMKPRALAKYDSQECSPLEWRVLAM